MRSLGRFTLLALLAASPAAAQTPAPLPARPVPDTRIPIAAVDARGVFARLGLDELTAAGLSLSSLTLPARGFGLSGGAHVYPWRGRSMAFGIGAEGLFARSSFAPVDATTTKPTGQVFRRQLSGVSGQLSMNFGHKTGWSYLTAGIGPLGFDSYVEPAIPNGDRSPTLNYGGGARWFNFDHLAFTVDLRFYATKPVLATTTTAARARHTVFVMSAGIALK